MSAQQRTGAAADLPPGTVVGVGRYAVGNAGGRYFTITRRCRHLGADLAAGSINEDGCLGRPAGQPSSSSGEPSLHVARRSLDSGRTACSGQVWVDEDFFRGQGVTEFLGTTP
jgi:hypothetical protein